MLALLDQRPRLGIEHVEHGRAHLGMHSRVQHVHAVTVDRGRHPGFASLSPVAFDALIVLELMASTGKSLKELRAGMDKYPQTMINVPVSDGARQRLANSVRITEAVRRAEVELNGRGRVILRPSGTEPLVRVTLEGADSSQVEELARQLADTVREELGA